MPNLKEYRDRIASVKSTRKITSAMKMVAASKLKKAQDQAEASQPYAMKMAQMLQNLSSNLVVTAETSPLLAGTGKEDAHLLIVMTSDRGLCGGFNGSIVRETVRQVKALKKQGKDVKLLFVGKKGYDVLKTEYRELIVGHGAMVEGKKLTYADAEKATKHVLEMFERGEFDVCTIVYNHFESVIAQIPTTKQIIPLVLEEKVESTEESGKPAISALYEFEPNEETLLAELLPYNVGIQVFSSMLDSCAGEQAARMTAMDNATRNAGDMIDNLSLQYNRARQAYITKELIEIISGAEAL